MASADRSSTSATGIWSSGTGAHRSTTSLASRGIRRAANDGRQSMAPREVRERRCVPPANERITM